MKILKTAGITILAALIIYFIVIVVLPSKVFVERSIIVDVSPIEAYSYLEDLRNFQEWAYWAEIDPSTVSKYTGCA